MPEKRTKLPSALFVGAIDIEAIKGLINKTQKTAPDIAAGLKKLRESYQFEEIIRLINFTRAC